jgi:hypothetical protein
MCWERHTRGQKKEKKKKTPIGYPTSGSNGLGEKISSGLIDRVARLHARQRGKKNVFPVGGRKKHGKDRRGKKRRIRDPVVVLVVKRFLLLHLALAVGGWLCRNVT